MKYPDRDVQHACAYKALPAGEIRAVKGRRRARDVWRCSQCGKRWSTLAGRGPEREPR